MSMNINIISVKEINVFDKYNNVNTFSLVILKSMCYANHLLTHYTFLFSVQIYTTKGALCAQKLGNGIFYQHFFYTQLFRYCPH